jgi:TRAP-type mannitol/chloroaromatic compound transport system substrate-binding protein
MLTRQQFLGGLAVAGGLATAQQRAFAQGNSLSLKMATAWAGAAPMDYGAKLFAERIEQLSGGRVKMQVFAGGALGNALRVSETVRNGVAQLGHNWMGYDWGRDPTTVLFGGYAGSPDGERMLHWLYTAGGAELQREYREEVFGVVSLPVFLRPCEVFLHSRKPVRTLADLQGLKIRTAGAWLDMAKELGAAPLTSAAGEVYPMLERGVIDAVEWGSPAENVPLGFHKIAKYIVIPGVHQPCAPFEMVFNKSFWEKLPATDKQLFELTARLVTFEGWMRLGQDDAKALEAYRAAGNEVITLDPSVARRVREIANTWATKTAEQNAHFKKVLEHQRAFMKSWADAETYRNVRA